MRSTTEPVTETVETTLGELVEAITRVALKAGETEQEGYLLASLALEDLLLGCQNKEETVVE